MGPGYSRFAALACEFRDDARVSNFPSAAGRRPFVPRAARPRTLSSGAATYFIISEA